MLDAIMRYLSSLCFCLVIEFVVGPHPHGHTVADLVDVAVVNIESHYNDKLCHDLMKINCAAHVMINDERVCGDDGVTYDNHCHFAKARCASILSKSHHVLHVQSHGPCLASTHISTSAPANIPISTPAQIPSSTQAITTVPIHDIFYNVFCSNVGFLSCTSGYNIVCGSNGQFYPNECAVSKDKCTDPTLTIVDKSNCHADII